MTWQIFSSRNRGLTPVSRRVSFVTIATFGLGAFVALAIGVTLYVSSIAGVRSTQSLISERAEELLNNLERRIESRLKPVSDQAEWIARLVQDGRVKVTDIERFDGIMFGALGTTPQVRSLTFIAPDGRVRRWLRNERIAQAEDWSDRPAIVEILKHAHQMTEHQWLPPIRAMTTRQAALLHATPLVVEGHFVGVLAQVVPVFRLSSDMALIGRESNVTPFILYGEDHVLAHPWLADDDAEGFDGPLPTIRQLGDVVLERLHNPDSRSPFGMRAVWSANTALARVNGEQHIFLYRELTQYYPRKLIVGAYINAESNGIGAPMRRVMLSILAGLGVLVAAVIAAALAGRWLSRPIQVLARAASSAHAGSIDKIPRLERSPIREFDAAAQAFNSMVDGLREQALIRDTLGAYVPQEVARKLLAGKGELEPVEQKATVLVCDIEAFTSLTDTLGARRVVEFLNDYFPAMAEIIERHGGVITQFQGDAVLAVFNVPIRDRNHAANALTAAMEIVRETDTREFAGVRVRNRVGISTGRVLAGAVGSREQRTYTVHGNTVNLASRIENMNKDYGTRILISGKTAERCGQFALRQIGEVQIRGYRETITLHTPEATHPVNIASAAA
jgi:adenylate cyclase